MDALVALRLFFAANVVLAFGWGLLALARKASTRTNAIRFGAQLRFGYAAVFIAVVMPILGHATWHLYRKLVV